jgi:hypothetical protein
MIGRKILAAATLIGLGSLGAAARGDEGAPNLPPTVSISEGVSGGKPALCIDVVDPDGASDLLGFAYEYTLDTGAIYSNSLGITLWVVGKKGLTAGDIEGGKRICITKLPGNVKTLKVTATDSELQQVSASATVPAAITAGNPKFGVVRAPPPPKKK